MVLVTGGTLVLLSYASRGRGSSALSMALAAIGSLPLFTVAAAGAASGVWASGLVVGGLGVGVLADEWLASRAGSDSAPPTLAATSMLAGAGVGAMALVSAGLLGFGRGNPGLGYLPLLGGAFILTSALMALGLFMPRARASAQAAAAVPYLVMAAILGAAARWPGVVVYGMLGIALVLERPLYGMMRRRAAERKVQPPSASIYEFGTEFIGWGFVLLIALTGSLAPTPHDRLGLALLTLAAALFTVAWFHFRSAEGAGIRHTVAAATIYSAIGAGLIHFSGGLESPFFLIFTVPIIALVWTRSPEKIVMPLAVAVAAVALESALALRDGEAAGAVLWGATPRLLGLALVSWFSFMLAKRNAQDRSRLRDARRQLQEVMDHMAEAVVTTDRLGRVVLLNPAASRLLGLGSGSLGQPFSAVVPLRREGGVLIGQAEHPVHRALANQEVPGERFSINSPAGERPLAISASPMFDAGGVSGVILLARDASVEAESERMRDDFFYIASHELRTPLTVMKGNLEIALDSAAQSPELRGAIQEALDSAARLIRMVNEFLDAARLEHGAMTLDLEDAHLPDLAQQAICTIRPEAARKGLEVAYKASGGLPSLRVDADRTVQILLNLLSNAVRFTSTGAIEVWHEKGPGWIDTLVGDTGMGIPAEHQGLLFTRFGQVGRGLRRSTGGSGLGLYIARKLAEQMGGSVELRRSVPGAGSTFALRLPVVGPGDRQ